MATQNGESAKRADQMLADLVQDADDYYNQLKGKHVSETRLDTLVVGLVVWFASFVVLGVGVISTIQRSMVIEYLLGAFLFAVVVAAIAGLVTFVMRRRRGFKFAELGTLLVKMKSGQVSSEDGLRLMDAMHQAAVVARKRKLDSAFKYGVLAFALVAVVGVNPGLGALAGVIVYLYYRFEALREFERGEERYEGSKRELLQSL